MNAMVCPGTKPWGQSQQVWCGVQPQGHDAYPIMDTLWPMPHLLRLAKDGTLLNDIRQRHTICGFGSGKPYDC